MHPLLASGPMLRTAFARLKPPSSVRRLSYPGPDPSAGGLTPMMKDWPYGTLFVGTTIGYFIAMYTERTYNKDKMVTKADLRNTMPAAK